METGQGRSSPTTPVAVKSPGLWGPLDLAGRLLPVTASFGQILPTSAGWLCHGLSRVLSKKKSYGLKTSAAKTVTVLVCIYIGLVLFYGGHTVNISYQLLIVLSALLLAPAGYGTAYSHPVQICKYL